MNSEEIKDYVVFSRDKEHLKFEDIATLLNGINSTDKYTRQYVYQVYKRKKEAERKTIPDAITLRVVELYSLTGSIKDTTRQLNREMNTNYSYYTVSNIIKLNKNLVDCRVDNIVSMLKNYLLDGGTTLEDIEESLRLYSEDISSYGLKKLLDEALRQALVDRLNSLHIMNESVFIGEYEEVFVKLLAEIQKKKEVSDL